MEWLIGERDIAGLGTECIDVELGWKTRNAVKLQLAAANRVSLVQLANLAQLPPAGIEITVAPLKLAGGSGGPARVFAVSGVRGGGGGGRNDGQRHGSHREGPNRAQRYLFTTGNMSIVKMVMLVKFENLTLRLD